MNVENYTKRVDQLIRLADDVLASETKSDYGSWINAELFSQFRTSALSFIEILFTKNHSYYKEFDRQVEKSDSYYTQLGKGIIIAIKMEIENGWIFTLKGIVSAEIFADFLEMAEHLIAEGYKDPAAVMIGSVWEEHLRQLCIKNSLPIEIGKDGK